MGFDAGSGSGPEDSSNNYSGDDNGNRGHDWSSFWACCFIWGIPLLIVIAIIYAFVH